MERESEMKTIKACALAFSMYSRLPMPKTEWDKDSMEYVFCFFPLVGVVLGLLLILWRRVSLFLELGSVLTASVCVILPIIYTGGIHLDGLCDTSDALASNSSRERKLEILKDSHIGAFALIACVVYLILQFGLWCEAVLDSISPVVLGTVFVLSRSLSALAAVTMKNARKSGMLASFTDALIGKKVLVAIIIWLIACVVVLLCFDLVTGGAVLMAAGLVYIYYAVTSSKNFGGITGDLAGYFLQLCELGCLAAAVLAVRLVNVL